MVRLENHSPLAACNPGGPRNFTAENIPLLVRISATDWKEGGWDLEQSIELCRRLKRLGVDLVDVSSGGDFTRDKNSPGTGLPSNIR